MNIATNVYLGEEIPLEAITQPILELMSSFFDGFGNLWSIAAYVLTALALFTIARRRGIRNPWLAWIPGGNMWMMGAIADDYWLVAHTIVKNRRKWLLGTYVAMYVAVFVAMITAITFWIYAVYLLNNGDDVGILYWALFAMTLLFWLSLMVAAVWHMVLNYMALYDIYHSCDSKHAKLFLVLSVLTNFCQPIFLMLCRKKDARIYTRGEATPKMPGGELPENPGGS